MKLSITTRGIPKIVATSYKIPVALVEAMFHATDESLDATVDLVRSFTPVMVYNRGGSNRVPGELRESVRRQMIYHDNHRVSGRVFTDKDWAPFVEHGTLEHGPARHMFSRGRVAARPLVNLIFGAHIGRAMDSK